MNNMNLGKIILIEFMR